MPLTAFDEAFVDVTNMMAGHVHDIAKRKGWYDKERNPLELLCLIHSEISEACEAFRHGNPPSDQVPEFSHAEIELADAVIRILDMAAHYEWDIGGAIRCKIEFNQSRTKRHGGKVY